MPRKIGMTPTYKPINVKPQKVFASGAGVANATGIMTSNGIELLVKTRTLLRLSQSSEEGAVSRVKALERLAANHLRACAAL